ncbi:hypothetical protein Tco_0836313 [Tanacetum coccineum]
MPKSSSEKKANKTLRRTTRISVRPCCLVNPISSNNLPPFQRFLPSSDYHVAPPSTSLDSPLTTPLALPRFSSKPVDLIFSTPPTSPHQFFDSLEDLPPRTTNPPPPQSTLESIKHLANQPPLVPDIMDMEPPLPPFPPDLPTLTQLMWSNDILPPLPHQTFYEHCQCTQVIVNDLRNEMRFILNHILDHLNTLTHQNYP